MGENLATVDASQFRSGECRGAKLRQWPASGPSAHAHGCLLSEGPIDTGVASSRGQPRRLGDRARAAMRIQHLSPRTERAYLHWTRRFHEFTGRRDPARLGAVEVTAFLSRLATVEHVATSTQNQALAALLFLYRHVLGLDLPWLDDLVRARQPERLPVVLSRDEVSLLLAELSGVAHLMASLLYESGLRLIECCRLRIKDVDFERRQILVRHGKGGKDRAALLPAAACEPLRLQIEAVRALHARDLVNNAGWVELPGALARKYPSEARSLPWQWLFPATRCYRHPPTGQLRRHHLHETVLQRSVKFAVAKSGLSKPATCHTLRNASA